MAKQRLIFMVLLLLSAILAVDVRAQDTQLSEPQAVEVRAEDD